MARAVEEPEMGCIRLRTLSVRACCFLASLHKGRYTGSERVGMRDVYALHPQMKHCIGCVCMCVCIRVHLLSMATCESIYLCVCVFICLLSILSAKISYIDCLL